MATLPDPIPGLDASGRALFEHMADARSHAEGRAHLGEVYARMFNNPGVTRVVGDLGEHLRFHGVLPDDVRELVILRFAARNHFGYIWSHHQHPASLAGIDEATIGALTAGDVPDGLCDASCAALQIVDQVVAKTSISDELPGPIRRRARRGWCGRARGVVRSLRSDGDDDDLLRDPHRNGFPRPAIPIPLSLKKRGSQTAEYRLKPSGFACVDVLVTGW